LRILALSRKPVTTDGQTGRPAARKTAKTAQRSRASSMIGRWLRRIWGMGIALLLGPESPGRWLPRARCPATTKSVQAGQMIVVRANDGSEIVTLGPSGFL
jgi:hypothetical protein